MATEGQEAESSCSPLEPSGDVGSDTFSSLILTAITPGQASPARHIPPPPLIQAAAKKLAQAGPLPMSGSGSWLGLRT